LRNLNDRKGQELIDGVLEVVDHLGLYTFRSSAAIR
jgi:hypothetical protein